MISQLAWFGLGLVALVAGAELLVKGASRLAYSFGISPLVVGLTVVAFGTSAPELAVSIKAVVAGQVDIAIGNVVGSNIFNVLFILGLAAVITPLVVAAQIIRQEVPIMIAASLLLLTLAWDGFVSRLDGAILFGLLLVYTVFLVRQSRRQTQVTHDEYAQEFGEGTAGPTRAWQRAQGRLPVQLVLIVAGLALLVLGSQWLVAAAVAFARWVGVSELVIGLTIVAAGTSLPEVAASVTASIKGERDIAIGNVIGSNTFNILGVLGMAALLSPAPLPMAPAMMAFDCWVMLVVAFACLPVLFTGRVIARWEGAVFLAYYAAYTAYLILDSQGHDALPQYSAAMLWFVVPLTLLTLAVAVGREMRGRPE
jgi:cation:H+ antiporter